MIEPVYNKIEFNKVVLKKDERFKAECFADLSGEEITCLTSSSFITEKSVEYSNGSVNYGGKIIYTLVYIDKDGVFMKKECEGEFSGSVPIKEQGDYKTDCDFTVEKTETETLSGRVKFVSYIKGEIFVKEKITSDCLTDGENVILNKKEKPIYKESSRINVYPIEEEFELGYEIDKVLCQKAELKIINSESGVGTVIVNGEISFSAMLLQKDENCSIIKEVKKIPFKAELENDEVMPASITCVSGRVKNLRSVVGVDGETKKSAVTLYIDVEFSVTAIDEEEMSIPVDAFSLKSEVELESDSGCYLIPYKRDSVGVKATGKYQCPEDAEILFPFGERAEVIYSEAEGKILISGLLYSEISLKSEKYSFIKTETPFATEIAMEEGTSIKRITAFVDKCGVRKTLINEGEITAEISVIIETEKKTEITFVKKLVEGGEKPCNESPISIFIPEENEELWSLAKRLNVSPEDLAVQNGELQFPLTGKERIVIYRQK